MQNYGYTAYPYGQNYGYNGYGQRFAPQTPQMAQPQPQPQPQLQMQPQQPIAPQVPQIQEFRHGTEDEIKPIIIYPNCVAYYIDYSKGRMYAKRADSSGLSSFEYYELTPINADGSPIKPQEPKPQFNPDDFAKKFVSVEQYQELVNRFEELKKFIGGKQNVGQKQPETRM